MLRIINIDVSVAKTAWTLFDHSGYGIMFMDGGDPDFILKIAFTGNELTQSAIYLERDGIIHFPANGEFERFYIAHLADTGTIKIAVLEKPSMDRPIYRRGGLLESTLNVAQTVDPLPVAETVDPLPAKIEEEVEFGVIANPSPGNISDFHIITAMCRLSRISFDFTTSGTAASRRPFIEVQNSGGQTQLEMWFKEAQIQSLTAAYTMARDLYPSYTAGRYASAPSAWCEIDNTWKFRVNCNGIQAADQISNIKFSLLKVFEV